MRTVLLQKLLKKYPVTLLDILHLQSLGPKKVAFLWSNFKAATVADVEKLALEGKLRDVPGFGEKSEQNILKAVEAFKRSTGLSPYAYLMQRRFERAKSEGDLPKDVDAADLARFITAVFQGMTVQAINGATRKELLRLGAIALRAWPK